MNLNLIKGICPIVAAPFAKDESVDYDSLRNLVATLAKGGCHALTLFGIAGEYYKLDEAEQREMMRVTIDEAHRHNVPVIVSDTRHATASAIAFAKEIEKAGADCMMVLPPFFLKPGADLICRHAAAKIMKDQEGAGNIVIIASNNAYCRFARASAYGSLKTGLVKMTQHIALEMSRFRIRCNSISPGWTDTKAARLDEKETTYYKIPLHRWVQPAEVGQTVLFLDSPAAASITGTDIVMDGGARLLSDKGEKYGFDHA